MGGNNTTLNRGETEAGRVWLNVVNAILSAPTVMLCACLDRVVQVGVTQGEPQDASQASTRDHTLAFEFQVRLEEERLILQQRWRAESHPCFPWTNPLRWQGRALPSALRSHLRGSSISKSEGGDEELKKTREFCRDPPLFKSTPKAFQPSCESCGATSLPAGRAWLAQSLGFGWCVRMKCLLGS